MVKTRVEVASLYGISARTLSRWMKKRNLKVSRELLNPKDLELIFETFGSPYSSMSPFREYVKRRRNEELINDLK